MPAKPDLRQAINSANNLRQVEASRDVTPSEPAKVRSAHYRPSREGKGNLTGYYPAPVKKQLRILAAEHETDIQDLLAEALNDLFAKYGKPELAPRKLARSATHT